MARRGTGEGSVFKRDEDNLWIGSIELPRGPNGERRKKRVSARTKSEVLRKLEEARTRRGQGLAPAPKKLSVAEFLESWLSTTLPASQRIKPTTLANYTSIVEGYINPSIGNVKVVTLNTGHVERMLLDLQERGLSGNTQRLARSVLRRALVTAEKRGLVMRNVAALTDGPQIDDARTGRTMTPTQAQKLLAAAAGHQLEVFVVVGIGLGLRPGETLALQWSGIDLRNRHLTVAGTLARVPGQGLVRSTPKTAGSRRMLHLTDRATAALRTHRTAQNAVRLEAGPDWEDHGYVLCTDIGRPLDPANVRHRFEDLTEQVLGDVWRPHEMRHSAASLLLAQGVPLRRISDILGHSSISVTSDVYGHLAPAALAEDIELLDRTIGAL